MNFFIKDNIKVKVCSAVDQSVLLNFLSNAKHPNNILFSLSAAVSICSYGWLINASQIACSLITSLFIGILALGIKPSYFPIIFINLF